MILYLCADLLWGTRIKSTADAIGVPCRPARTPEMLRARLADSPVRALIVDLDAGDAAIELIRSARDIERAAGPPATTDRGRSAGAPSNPAGGANPGTPPPIPPRLFILAFGPHVAVELFARAKEAGADESLARAAFDRRLPDILRALEAGPANPLTPPGA